MYPVQDGNMKVQFNCDVDNMQFSKEFNTAEEYQEYLNKEFDKELKWGRICAYFKVIGVIIIMPFYIIYELLKQFVKWLNDKT